MSYIRKIAAAAILAASYGSVYAVPVTVNSAFTGAEPTLGDRLTRNGTPSNCVGMKPYPGLQGAGAYSYRTDAIANAGVSQCMTVTINEGTCAVNSTFISVYAGAFNPADLSQNYLGDAGVSGNVSFQVTVPAATNLVFVTNRVASGANPACAYSFTYDLPIPAVAESVPTLSEWGMITLSALMALGAVVVTRRSRS